MLRTIRPGETLEWPEDRPKITIERETLERAAQALAYCYSAIENMSDDEDDMISRSNAALRAALAAQPAEPVAVNPGTWRPCLNCRYDSTGTWEHSIGGPNDPTTFKAPPAPAAVPPDERVRVLREALERYVDHFGDPLQCARAALEATK